MQLRRQRDVIEISIKLKYIKGRTTSDDQMEAKYFEDAFKKIVKALEELLSAVPGAKTNIEKALAEQARKTSDAPVGAGHRQREDVKGTALKITPEKIKSTSVNNVIYVEDKKFANAKVTKYPQTEKTNRVPTDMVPFVNEKHQNSTSLQGDSSIRMISSDPAKVDQRCQERFNEPKFKPAIKKIEAVSLHSEVPPQLPDLQDRHRKLDQSVPSEKNGLVLSNTVTSDLSLPPKLPLEVKDRGRKPDLSIPGENTSLVLSNTTNSDLKPPEVKDSYRKLGRSIQDEKNGSVFSNTTSSYLSWPPKPPEMTDRYRKHDKSSSGEKYGLMSRNTTSSDVCLPLKPPGAKGLSEKLEYSNPTEKNGEM
ncbi:conserved hypothetical protein [Ricinus communis]|uniref:Uncharacterized protein n=1 Tax=Ricinus communis TaxID=3988 RepID=B9S8L4_RICCO|nr:conserved hypothetical protein [Ricinus communis]